MKKIPSLLILSSLLILFILSNNVKSEVNKSHEDKNILFEISKSLTINFEGQTLTLNFKNLNVQDDEKKHIESIEYDYIFNDGQAQKNGFKKSIIVNEIVRIDKRNVNLNVIEGSQRIKHGKINFSWSYSTKESIYLYIPQKYTYKAS